jgi:hypothetical protein
VCQAIYWTQPGCSFRTHTSLIDGHPTNDKIFLQNKIPKKEPKVKTNPKYLILILGSLVILAFVLIACSGTSTQQPEADADVNQENQVMLPAVEVNSDKEDETTAEVNEAAYPVPEEKVEAGSYPAPEVQAQVDTASEAYPAPEETAPKPTSRGDQLVATNPATVKLASGQVQLVELFAYW